MENNTKVIYLKDYQQPSYWPESIHLEFDINEKTTTVTATTKYHKNPAQIPNTLVLDGSAKLLELLIDKQKTDNYKLEGDLLTITDLPEAFSITIVTELDPFNDKSCMGFYASNGNLFTQCEPEGFRKITYYQDRPDVMAKFTTVICADPIQYPVLLSNGNKISEETLANGRKKVVWLDPFKKPSYLFALVAGKFSLIKDTIVSRSGRTINLEVYSEPTSIDQCQYCLDSLKRAIKWDENRFNLEYDLDTYMIVATGDFNMGAMENKGLNIFNTKYVLANSKTATDTDFINVEAVVGHEYFHNWTGNRVTCRDWFQLSLKEGLTVFRDQEFTSDLHSRAVKRIQDVKALRQLQFTEDASALAHPVRPESYIQINNFYTMTIYEKGAEVVRMYQTILGKTGFNLGMELYISRHDGFAATCEDFCNAMADANKFDLTQFMLWYSQAGTPHLEVRDEYNSDSGEYILTIKQTIPDTPGQTDKQPMLIPVSIGLIGEDGEELAVELVEGEVVFPDGNCVLLVKDNLNSFRFKVKQQPTPSLLRGFSAPVTLDYPYQEEQLLILAAYDKDSFNRWEALQTLYRNTIKNLYQHTNNNTLPESLLSALRKILTDSSLDPNLRSLTATLPGFAELTTSFKPVEVNRLVATLNKLKKSLGNSLESVWLNTYNENLTTKYQLSDAGKRSLKNIALSYLLASDNSQKYLTLAKTQYVSADNMTDKLAALSAVNDSEDGIRDELLDNYLNEFQTYPLAMDKWFLLQSQSQLPNTLSRVKKLLEHPGFDKENPNKLYSLVRSFTSNPIIFNSKEGYEFVTDEILRIDKFNPSVASRVAHGFSQVTSLTSDYQNIAKPFLAKLLAQKNLSKDVYELISKTFEQL